MQASDTAIALCDRGVPLTPCTVAPSRKPVMITCDTSPRRLGLKLHRNKTQACPQAALACDNSQHFLIQLSSSTCAPQTQQGLRWCDLHLASISSPAGLAGVAHSDLFGADTYLLRWYVLVLESASMS